MCKKTIASEFVSFGHPDKIADQISDAILDELLKQDAHTRAGIECLVKDNVVVLGGEIHTSAIIDYEAIVRDVFSNLPFPSNHHLSPSEIKIINLIGQQSKEIHNGVDKSEEIIGAGDQGFVVGFASNETDVFMPLGHHIAKVICNYVSTQTNKLWGWGPDTKSQVLVDYDTSGEATVTSILVSTMHQGNLESVRNEIKEDILSNKIGLSDYLYETYIKNNETLKIDVNPCGEWKTGGPVSDCGVTGRKIVVDQFGGYCNVGGGNIGGKDLTKIDRSAAYMSRYIAKNIVAAGLAKTAKVELSYMIGVPEPSSINIELTSSNAMFNKNNLEFMAEKIKDWVKANVDLTPYGIMKRFKGSLPRYYHISKNGHYGYSVDNDYSLSEIYPWEKLDLVHKMSIDLNIAPF